jgi:pimeloyl-ACP methyl ester carboxylesterase
MMTTYVLIPGSGGDAWSWHLLEPELRARGHDVVPVDLPADDDSAGLAEYADTVVEAIGGRTDLIVVGHSMGGLTAPLVCERIPVRLLVLLNAMVPLPGESGGEWWTNTGHADAVRDLDMREGRPTGGEFDAMTAFFHDVPPEVAAEAMRTGKDQSGTPFEWPWPLAAWPDVPTRFLQARDDRFFPLGFQRRVVEERLGIALDEMPGGHMVALSRPRELADRLEAYRVALDTPERGSDPPAGIGKPAQRALSAAGYARLDQLAQVTESDLLRLHGMGPKALARLSEALADAGLSFAADS